MAVYGDCLTSDASLQWPVFDTSSLALLFSPEGVQVSELILIMCQHATVCIQVGQFYPKIRRFLSLLYANLGMK